MNAGAGAVVVGVGEALWDCFADSKRPGGAPANVAFHAHQLGAEGVVCSRVGQDGSGDELVSTLESLGLSTQFVQRDAEHPTGSVTVQTSPSGEPRYTIHSQVAWDFLEFNPALEGLLSRASVVAFGTLAMRHSRSRDCIEQCLATASGALRLFDVNLRQSFYTPDRVRLGLRAANVLKLNEHEARILPALLEIAPRTPAELARWCLHEHALERVCITRGAEGCWLFSAQEELEVPAVEVEPVDPVGAGDAFAAAFALASWRRAPLRAAGEFATAVAARVAAQAGAMAPLGEPPPLPP